MCDLVTSAVTTVRVTTIMLRTKMASVEPPAQIIDGRRSWVGLAACTQINGEHTLALCGGRGGLTRSRTMSYEERDDGRASGGGREKRERE